MIIRKFFILAPISAAILACGPAPEKSSEEPKITGGVMGLVSPFDTLEVEFTTDLEDISASQVESNIDIRWEVDEDILRIYGDSNYTSGIALLEPKKTYTVTLRDVESADGDIQEDPQVLTFVTMPILDKDGKDKTGAIKSNGEYGNAEVLADAEKFFDGTALKTGISVAGAISGIGRGVEDTDDWFRIKLKQGDSLQIDLTNLHDNLQLRLFGPENEDAEMSSFVDVSDEDGAEDERLSFSPSVERHAFGTRNLDTYLNYWIRVSPSDNADLKSSYVLTVKKLR